MAGLDRKWRREEREQGIKRDRDIKSEKHWKEAEEVGARSHKAKTTVGSGCSWRPDRKLDSVGERWRMSSKTTAGGKGEKSIRIEREWFREATRAAQAELHQPAVHIGFDPDHRDKREDWIAVPVAVFKRINEVLDAVEQREYTKANVLLDLFGRV